MKKIYIHTKTQKEFNKVLEIFEKKGWVWDSGQKPTLLKTGFNTYGSITIIEYKDRFMFGRKVNEKVISFKKFLYLEAMKQFEGDEIATSPATAGSSQGREMKQFEESQNPPVAEATSPFKEGGNSHSLGWTPKRDEQYYFISHSGVVAKTRNILELDVKLFEIGNCFKTEAEAKKALKKRQALRRIHKYMRENDLFFDDMDWSKFKENFQICGWNYKRNKPAIEYYQTANISKGNLIFRTPEDRKKVLKNCAEDLKIFLKD